MSPSIFNWHHIDSLVRTVLRELLQNAADASASKVTIKFETMPSSTVPLPHNITPSALLKHAVLHHTLKRLVVTNNGQPFGTNDWSRLKRIAEGNPDETKIGAFGVGFYSVFSDCEEPFVSSGSEAMAFYWKGNSLFTRKMHLTETQASPDTTFVLDYRNTSTTIPGLLPLSQFLASSLTFVGLSGIELWLDDWRILSFNKLAAPGCAMPIPKDLETKTSESVVKIQSIIQETVQLDATWLNVIGWKPKTATSINSASGSKAPPSSQSLKAFFSRFASSHNNAAAERAAKEEKEAQEAIHEDLLREHKKTVFFNVRTANLLTSVSQTFAIELERATKKPPPKSTKVAVLTASYDGNVLSSEKQPSASQGVDIFATLLPSKTGRIFIGFPTHQTTGLAAHISAPSVIPTVERESIDLNARWVRSWNQEILRAAGIVCRIAWSGDISSIKEKLSRKLREDDRTRICDHDIAKVTPNAIHVLNQFTFSESTPAAQVGSLVEEAFWTCDRFASIEILSSRGVLPSQQVRLGTDELSFVDGIPTVPTLLLEKAGGFVKKLTDYGIIVEITTADIKKELENQALKAKQLTEFLQWLVQKLRVQDIDPAAAKSLLSVTVANDEEEGNKSIYVGQIQYFLNPSKIPLDLPVPTTTLSFKFTKMIDKPSLESLGWEDLQIVPWVKFLLDRQSSKAEDCNLEKNSAFANRVLPVISKQWDGLSQNSKATILNLLRPRTVIPTKLGMRKPSDAYFQSVKLFDDLPIITVNAVKEKFLNTLGVRKTIDLNLVFNRLLDEKASDSNRPKWSHVELIKYLASVRNDIPKEDIKKLQQTPICAAENDSSNRQYKVGDLFEPKDEVRALNIKLLKWPGIYRTGSEEGRFLTSLGLRSHPTAAELITIITQASSQMDVILREKALKYLVDFQHQHGYSANEIGSSVLPFLPIEGNEKGLSIPSKCFTNEKVALLGYNVLRRDLHPHATKLGVQANPPIRECVMWLVKNPPESQRSARQLFEYFATRLNDLAGQPLDLLSKSDIVPVIPHGATSLENSAGFKRLPPTMCFLGAGGRYVDIFDYVDFGDAANAFLVRCGSKPEPSILELARLVANEPARVFTIFNSTNRYLSLLTTIADSWPSLKKDKDLVKSMRSSPFLLASREHSVSHGLSRNSVVEELDFDEDEEERTVKSWELATASKINTIDDVINYNLFKDVILAAPQEEELESLYASLGSLPLTSIVTERERIGPVNRDQSPASNLKKLVNERIKLFFHDVSRDQIKHDASWVDKNLRFVAVSNLQLQRSLKTGGNLKTVETSAISSNQSQLGPTIYFNYRAPDLFNVSQALLSVVLNRPKTQQAIVLTTLLETDLSKLRRRGYDVSRILKRRQIEERIAEEQSKKAWAEERLRLQQEEIARQSQRGEDEKHAQMPGVFPDTPDSLNNQVGRLPLETDDATRQQSRGFFSNLTKTLNDQLQQAQTSLTQRPKSTTPVGPDGPTPVTSPQQLHQNLINAIKASRPHNSKNVVSAPVISDVKETNTFCDAKPGQNISFVSTVQPNMKVFLSNTLENKDKFFAANESGFVHFAAVILQVARAIGVPQESLHIFHDEGSSTIAFNSKKALFFNYRYFDTLHSPDVMQGRVADAVIYWFVVCSHELAHNIIKDHSAAHSYYTESFIAQFFKNIASSVAISHGPQQQQQPSPPLQPNPPFPGRTSTSSDPRGPPPRYTDSI